MIPIFQDAIMQLQRHHGLQICKVTENDATCIVDVNINVPLPSRAKVNGKSVTGVLAVEPCVICFTEDWPLKAPSIKLRKDFPLNLPHINPHKPGHLVSPCLFEGSLDEMLHRFGLDRIIDQLIEWLRSAAADQLINMEQGWEPTRRDDCPGTLVFSAEKAIAEVPMDGTILTVNGIYVSVNDHVHGYSELLPEEANFTQNIREIKSGKVASGNVQIFLARAVDADRLPQIVSTYQPESVHDLDSLKTRAQELGIDIDTLLEKLDTYYRCSVMQVDQDCRSWSQGLLAFIILLVQRPAQIVGSPGRDVELLPYLVRYEISSNPLVERKAEVTPAFHTHILSPALLTKASGIDPVNTSIPIVLLGCGSLGSKVALHMGRAGFGKLTFVDNESMSPHNLARHAVVKNPGVYFSKVESMQDAFRQLSHNDTRGYDEDVTRILLQPDQFSKVIGCENGLILDTTASLTVLVAETMSEQLDSSSMRLVRSSMYGQGRCTVIMLEGSDRSCRVDDLVSYLFDQCRDNEALRHAIAGESSDPTRLFVGDNCRSLTTLMPDSKVSKAAALVAEQIQNWLADGLPTQGHLIFGVEELNKIGIRWFDIVVEPSIVLEVNDDGGWHIRVLNHVAQAIDNDARHWGNIETGGAILGHVDFQTKTIILAGLVFAPLDSVRESLRFVLGTEGLISALRQANEDSIGYLMFVGTWHSHPMGGSHSGIDKATLLKIAQDAGGLPAVSLIWTPSGFNCAVERW